jgi:predicted membrane protein
LKKFAGAILLAIGTMILLFHLGHILFLLLIGTLVYLGVKKLTHADSKKQKRAAYILLGIAILLCLCNSPFLIGLLIGGGLLYLGWKMINQNQVAYRSNQEEKPFDNSFDAEWKQFVKNHNKDE